MRLPDLQRIALIAMALCTWEAKFEEVQRHYINIYQSNFLLYYTKFIEVSCKVFSPFFCLKQNKINSKNWGETNFEVSKKQKDV